MKIMLTKRVSDFLQTLTPEKLNIIFGKLDILEQTDASNVLYIKDVTLLGEKDKPIYAYCIDDSEYIVFGINKKNAVIVDIIKLLDDNIESLISPIDDNE